MKNLRIVLCVSLILSMLSACSTKPNETNQKDKPETIVGEDFDEFGGADAYAGSGDNPSSKYYVNPDFYNMKSDDTLTIIENFKTMQQTTEWACGNTTALMVLNHFNKSNITEMDLALAMESSIDKDVEGSLPGSANNYFEYGTNVAGMYKYLSNLMDFEVVETNYIENPTESDLITKADGSVINYIDNIKPTFTNNALYTSENSDDSEAYVDNAMNSYFVKWITGHLIANRPIMVEWADWNGHWQAIIDYDNNGIPEIGDDILVFADPYDTSDHWQDGYYYFGIERFFSMWNDASIAKKPYQVQSYIIIDKKK